jgi:hypothetical protein
MAITQRIPFPFFELIEGYLAAEANEWDDDER